MINLAENIFRSVLLLSNPAENFTEKIKEFCNDCANNGYTAGEIENAKYALCAWIDEYIYVNYNVFSQSLVLNEFQDAEAGRHFFERLESIHQNSNPAPLLEVYAKCILFGFMGRFRMGETAELKRILNSAISKIDLLKRLDYKPATKSKHRFSFRRGVKNILVNDSEAVKKQTPPKGYRYIYSDMKNMDGLPFLDGIISINQSVPPQKMPVYTVENLEIPEFDQTLDRNYEFNSNHLNFYLHKYFLDNAACKNLLSLPKKLEQFKAGENFYTTPFFPFMQSEKPLAYSLAKKVLFILSLMSIVLSILPLIDKHKEEIKIEHLRIVKDSLDLEFERDVKNLEVQYQKQIFEKFPFKEGKMPSVAEINEYLTEFYKFIDAIDTISDSRIKFNSKALAQLQLLKSNTWSDIPVSIIIKAPQTASVEFSIDSQYVEIERGKNAIIETVFPQKSRNGIELNVKTANNVFKESISGEWSLLKIKDRHVFSFMDRSYLVDVELNVHWHLPKNTIKPKDWFELRLEPNLTENFPLTRNLGE